MFKSTSSHTNTRFALLLMAFSTFPMAAYASNVIIRTPLGNNVPEQNLVMTRPTEVQAPARPFVMNPGLNDAWYDPATDGQGFFITVFPTLGSVVIAWFTYDTEPPPEEATANLGDPGHRWMTVEGPYNGNTAEMTIDIISGGLFDTNSSVTHTPGGTVKLTFDDCNKGTVKYDIPSINRQGSIPIQRVALDNVVLCKALQESP